MKHLLIILSVITSIMLFNTSCTSSNHVENNTTTHINQKRNNAITDEDGRFFFVYVDDRSNYQSDGSIYRSFYILVDRETHIQYLVYQRGGYNVSGIAMTPLLDKDGNVTYYNGKPTDLYILGPFR